MAERPCPLVAVVGERCYPCRSHEGGSHNFAVRWPPCPAPFCLLKPGHRTLHDIPAGQAVITADPALLPRRVAQVTLALMEAWSAPEGGAPVTTTEVMEYDEAALTAGSTSSALTRAVRLGLADRAAPRGLWMATEMAWGIRRGLEDHLAEDADRG